jgi:hypothetical protein
VRVASVISLVWVVAMLAIVGVGMWRLIAGPSRATRQRLEAMLRGRNRELLDVRWVARPEWSRRSRSLLRARVRTFDGYEQTEYFLLDEWTDLFSSRPTIRELGTRPGSMDDFSA